MRDVCMFCVAGLRCVFGAPWTELVVVRVSARKQASYHISSSESRRRCRQQ